MTYFLIIFNILLLVGESPERISIKTLSQSFVSQRLDFGDYNPYCWYSLSNNVLLITPVIAKQALYWRDSSFSSA